MPGIRIGASGFINAAEWTQRRLEAFAVAQPAGNRLMKAHAMIRDVNERRIILRANDERALYCVTEAIWTVLEQYIVARALGAPGRVLHPIQFSKLEMMLSGADTEDEDKNPLARNTQFELYAGATLIMGDVRTRLAEPDLRADYLGREISIAAKRVRSAKQLTKRAKDAVDQITDSGLPGIAALNVDLLLRKTGAGDLDTEQLAERLAAIKEVDKLLSKHEEVLGSLIFARDAVWKFSGDKPSVALASWHRFAVYPRTPEEKERGEEFWRKARERIDARMDNL